MKKLLALMIAGLLTVGVMGCQKQTTDTPASNTESTTSETAPSDVKTMTGQEVVDAMKSDAGQVGDILLIDVRTADEYAKGHIDGATNIPHEDLESKLAEIETYKDKQVILYCNTGNKSGEAAKLLLEKGFTNVNNAQGVEEFEYSLMAE